MVGLESVGLQAETRLEEPALADKFEVLGLGRGALAGLYESLKEDFLAVVGR